MNDASILISAPAIGAEMDAVASGLHRLAIQRQSRLKATKGRFNLFTILLNINDEVRLHTRYLAHLLDPEDHEFNGPQHDCGAVFLTAFLNELLKGVRDHKGETVVPVELKNIDTGKAKVFSEFHTGCKGNIDLLIQCDGWAVAIENKISAAEQPAQIQDYADYLNERHHDKWVLLYLTPDGKESRTHGDRRYYRISYRDTILPWLEECSRATYASVNINQALQQYSQVVRELTGMKKEQDMSPIIDVVRKHPSIIKDLADITDAVRRLTDEMRSLFVAEISKALTQQEGQYELKQQIVSGDWAIQRRGKAVEAKGYNVVLKSPEDPFPHFYMTVVPADGKQWPDEPALTQLFNALKKTFPEDLQGVEDNKRVSKNGYYRGGWCYFPDPKLSNAGLSDLLIKQASNADSISVIAKQIAREIVSFVQVVETT